MYQVTVFFATEKLIVPAATRHDANCIVKEFQLLGIDAEVRIELA